LKDEEGRVLLEDHDISKRWESYFCKLMNEGASDENQLHDTTERSEIAGITSGEVDRALKKMKSGKAVGPDGIPVEIWKIAGKRACEWLKSVFDKLLHGERMPEEWRQSWLVPVYKGKGNIQECTNYRGIKLLSHTMKLWERVVESRLRAETKIDDNQFGFMPGRSTTEPIFMLRQMMEKRRRRKKKMQIVFVDLEKAYDRVPRKLVWEVMKCRGVNDRYIDAVQDMYTGVRTSVKTENGQSNSFEVRIGVHQGSTLSPYLFILVMDELLKGVIKEVPWCMLFADDMVIIGDTVEEVNEMLEKVREALESKGLKINKEKTEHLESRWKGESAGGERVNIQGVELKKVPEYKYPGLSCKMMGN